MNSGEKFFATRDIAPVYFRIDKEVVCVCERAQYPPKKAATPVGNGCPAEAPGRGSRLLCTLLLGVGRAKGELPCVLDMHGSFLMCSGRRIRGQAAEITCTSSHWLEILTSAFCVQEEREVDFAPDTWASVPSRGNGA